jgi:hypothetical protein
MGRVSITLFALYLLLGTAASGRAEDKPPSAKDDTRLTRAVNYVEPRAYLGEALAEISHQTGVRREVSDKLDPASGVELMLQVSHWPLEEVMAGITTLMSSPYARGHWRRQGSGAERSYLLEHEPSLARAAARARADLDARFARDVRDACRAARDGLDGIRKLRALRPDLFADEQ